MSTFCLQSFFLRAHGMYSPFGNKVVLSKYRGRSRDLWKQGENTYHRHLESKKRYYNEYELDQTLYERQNQTLSPQENGSMRKSSMTVPCN